LRRRRRIGFALRIEAFRQAVVGCEAWFYVVRCSGVLYLDLDLPSALRWLDDPEGFLMAHAQQQVILDKVQRIPELLGILRTVIDQRLRMNQPSGQLLLLGSVTGVLQQQSSENLALCTDSRFGWGAQCVLAW
jgi:hypothetical protein